MTYGNYPDFSQVNKILIIKFRHLGDVLLSTPIFTTLKKYYPEIAIDALVYEEAKPLLKDLPAVHTVYTKKRKKKGFWKNIYEEVLFLKKLKKNRYDLILNLTEGDRGAIICRVLRPKYKVGIKGKYKGYTHEIKDCLTPRHQVERELDALRVMGIFPKENERGLSFPEIKLPMNIDHGFSEYFLFCPFARWRFKGLSILQMQELIKFLIQKGQKVILTGANSSSEIALAQEVCASFSKKDVCNLVGKIHLEELASLMKKAKAVICIDSFALHLASCFKKKTLVFFGPTSDSKWGPWKNPNAVVLTKNLSCRPCLMDGCGGSKYADCLATLDMKRAFSYLEEWIDSSKEKVFPK